jgi:hypothetical protein
MIETHDENARTRTLRQINAEKLSGAQLRNRKFSSFFSSRLGSHHVPMTVIENIAYRFAFTFHGKCLLE